MRLSTNSMYSTATSRILDLQANQSRLQNQISTGKRIMTPSDDPIGTSRALVLSQTQSINAQFLANRQTAQTQLNTAETVLNSITNVIISAQSTLTSAGNGALNNTDRATIANELSNDLEQLVSLANAKDGVGNYLFSGYATTTAPFVKTATGYSYQGDSNQLSLQVSSSRQMAVNNNGANIFQAGGNDIFQKLTDIVNLLRMPVATSADSAALSAGLAVADNGFKSALDNVLSVRSDFGSKLKEIDSLDDFSASATIAYEQNLSDLQDLDYTKALSDLAKQQTILEAAQKSFVKTSSLSLFDII